MRKVLAIVLLSIAASDALAAAARVDFVYGKVTVSGPDGRERPLARGDELDNGDTVRTADGRAQLRFTDGAYVSLQPQSEFAIREYRFDGKTDGAERGLFGLARGAMRTVTGLIGRVNRERYRVTTPTATIGIRGTGGVIQVLDDGATLIIGTSGIWLLANAAGSIDVPAGMSAVATGALGTPPQRSSRAPQAGPAPLIADAALPPAASQHPFRQGEQRDPDGKSSSLTRALAALPPSPVQPVEPTPPNPPAPSVLSSGPGFTAAFAFSRIDRAQPQLVLGTGATAQFDVAGQLLQADLAPALFSSDNGTHADFGTDGVLAWGRWTGAVGAGTGSETYSPSQGLHYVIGMPTPVMPTQGTATYLLAGATRPTFTDGSATPGTFSGSLNVDFGRLAVGVNLNVGIDGRNYGLGGEAAISGSGFSGSTNNPAGVGLISASGCATICSASLSGFFAGPAAQRAGVGYTIVDDKQVVGAAAFTKQP